MSGLSVDADGLRLAGARSDGLAADLTTPSGQTGGSGNVPTVAAVQAISALIESTRADQAVYLSGGANSLRSGASAYEGSDKGSASNIAEKM
ncbi:hypothetical protein [Mycobacteroides abscessus]|uniref:hypothetical protein n=1 Tax=Mycobacteroides abscessus TaxID=36809 RepID=UPI00092C3393|nr:hypothetical protein [Mycobacteroides abscessus]SIE00969.1 Uncharacterised protein [Mycobacteroides abscessus subsp. abscessus]SKV07191.1 Uncharacterised protein [Mycobacteroides abscessus subsp. abscessus]